MREGILDKLPTTLDPEKIVLVVGTDRVPGISGLREVASQLNNGHEWVRLEIREQMSEGQLTSKTAVILTMITTNHGNLQKIRNATKSNGICMVPQALTIGEVKQILNHLAKLRHPAEKVTANPTTNLTGTRRTVTPPTVSKTETAQEPVAVEPQGEQVKDSVMEMTQFRTSDPEEVNTALAALDSFSVVFSETQYAVLTIGERLKEVITECGQLKEQVITKDGEIADLRTQLGKAEYLQKENGILVAKNKDLQDEVQRLEQAFNNLENLIKGARKK